MEVTVDLGGLSAGTDIMGPEFCCTEKVLFVEVKQDQVHGHTSIFELLSLENIKAIYSRSSLVFLALPYLSI